MAALPVTIVGQDQNGNPITIVGMISITGYHPSHPIPPNIWPDPPDAGKPPGGGGGSPPGFWGPPGPWPTPPIAFPPGWVGGIPPGGWPPDGGGGDGDKPPAGPLIDWKIAWSPDTGWIVVGVPNVPHPAPAEAPKT